MGVLLVVPGTAAASLTISLSVCYHTIFVHIEFWLQQLSEMEQLCYVTVQLFHHRPPMM